MRRYGIIFLTGLLLAGTVACKKKGCTDEFAENFDTEAEKDDETCTYLSDKLLGTYNVSQECYYNGTNTYQLVVLAGTAKNEIILQNLYDDVTVKATITGTQFAFKQDVTGITYEGTGYMVGTGMTINMELCETYYYPCTDPESCTLTCTK